MHTRSMVAFDYAECFQRASLPHMDRRDESHLGARYEFAAHCAHSYRNDLLVVPLRQRATQLLLVKDESDPENRSYALSVGDAESDSAGDVCQ